MRSFMRYTVIVFFIVFISSCDNFVQEKGNGTITSEQRDLEPFKEIQIKGSYDVILKKSDKNSLQITTDENLHQYIKTEVNGEVFKIDSEASLSSDEPVKLEIGYNQIQAIGVSGAAIIQNTEAISGDYLRLEMSGAGSIDLKLDVKALKINISGAGSISLAGQVIEQNIQMSGAGLLKASDLISRKCEINISGVGGASVYAEEKLKATVSGVGGVNYSGNPKEVVTDITGLGKVSQDEGERQ